MALSLGCIIGVFVTAAATRGCYCEEPPSENILYVPKGTHPISLDYLTDGNVRRVNYTVTDKILEAYNTTVKELQGGTLHKGGTGLVLELESGKRIEVHVTERTVVQLIDKSGKQDFGVDLEAFNNLKMEDIKNDSTLLPVVRSAVLGWPTSHWRPVRSVTITSNATAVTVTLNRKNAVLTATTHVIHPALIWNNAHGLAVVVVHTRSSHVTFKYVFPTAEFGGFRDLMGLIKTVSQGRLVIVVGLHDGSLQLQEARQFLQQQGALGVQQYRFRDNWAWVFIKGGVTLGETLSPNLVTVEDRIRHIGELTPDQQDNSTDLLHKDLPDRPSLQYNFDAQGFDDQITAAYNNEAIRAVGNKVGNPILMDVRIPVHEEPVLLLMEYDICDAWHRLNAADQHWRARVKFCQTHDGYGSLCSCEEPFVIAPNNTNESPLYEKDIPIVILAGNRTRLLFRLLESLASQPGVHLGNLLVVMDGWQEGVARLAYMLGFNLLQHKEEGVGSVRVSRNLRFGLYNALNVHPQAEAFVVLEDDLVLAPDFYRYMQHTSHVFPLDKTIYCVSAFNHLSYPHTAYNASQLYRVESFPAYGWMVPRYVVENLLPRWFPSNVTHDWDFMMGMSLLSNKRECVIPDVNRALHGGIVGLHATASWFTERHYSRRTVNQDPNVQLMPVERLVLDAYEADMSDLLSKATVLELEDTTGVNLPQSETGVYVTYVDQPLASNVTSGDGTIYPDEGPNEPVFKLVGETLHIWNTDVRELHDSCWRLHLNNATLLVVGYPKSRYSRFKPPNIPPATTTTTNTDSFIHEEYTMAHFYRIPIRIHYDVTAVQIWKRAFDDDDDNEDTDEDDIFKYVKTDYYDDVRFKRFEINMI